MTLMNLILTAGVVGSAWYILRQDVRTGGKMLKQNIKTIRGWMEEAQHSSAAKEAVQDIKQLPEQMRPPQDLHSGPGPKGAADPGGSFAASAVPKQQPKKETPPEGLQ